ncbi:MAG: hypothetical protein V2A76_13405 [Planctomycetota bacterium]
MRGLLARHLRESARFDLDSGLRQEFELDEARLRELAEIGYLDPGTEEH